MIDWNEIMIKTHQWKNCYATIIKHTDVQLRHTTINTSLCIPDYIYMVLKSQFNCTKLSKKIQQINFENYILLEARY